MIEVNNLTKKYRDNVILDAVTTTFPTGKITALIGPNGAGKSTLLMMIAKLLESTSGQIAIDNNNIDAIKISDYAKLVATLRQSIGFNLRLTVEELVSFGRFPYSQGKLTDNDRQAVCHALDFLQLSHLKTTYLDELSGGQRQMAFLAMTIAQQTDIILLDEPLNNLDMNHAVRIMQALRQLCEKQQKTVVLVIHDINFAVNYSDHIVAIKQGKIFFEGSVEQVLTETNLENLYDLKFEIIRHQNSLLCNYFKLT